MAISKESSDGSFQSSGDKAFIVKLSEHIQANLNNDQFGVDSLAQAVGMSRSSLHRKLHNLLGISTSQFIREYRLKRALEILKQEDITASEVAYRVGFSSATYFSTSFHKFYGYTPGEAKSRTRNEESIPETMEVLSANAKNSKSEKGGLQKFVLWGALLLAVVSLALFFYSNAFKQNRKINTVIGENSIVVLPFKNLSTNEENQYFADGVMDEILIRLSSIRELRTISRTTAEKYRNISKTTPEIARELGVSHTLEASIQKYGDTVRIIVQLIEASSDRQLWAQDFKKEYKDIFGLQSDIAKRIATELKTTLSSTELEQIEKRYTTDISAYNLYLKGRYFWNRRTKEDLQASIKYFEQSIEKDPDYALAYSGLADAYYGLTRQAFIPDSFGTSKTRELLLKSIELDADIAQTHATLGMVKCWSDWDWDAAEKEFKRAIQLNPNYAIGHHYYADFLLHIRGQYDASREHAKKALFLNPLSYETAFVSAWHLFIEGRYDEALIETEKAYELNNHIDVNWLNFYIYATTNKSEEANREMEEVMKTMKKEDADSLRFSYSRFGINGIFRWWINFDIENNTADPFALAERYAFLGEKEKALTALEASYKQHSQFIPLINHYAFFDGLKEEPRFMAILEKMKL